ncbi:hypothetical protein DFH09DRAFT_1142886 [Mycena vulgaris]|nr:hypothetical protein DFH09DRAFT_1142886 [Mycena vulgaris]
MQSESEDLRIPDKAIHDKEIARLQAKVSIARRTIDDLNAKICDLEKQGVKLANSLGFATVYSAQSFVDIADDRTPYKELSERIERLQADHDSMRTELQELRIERDVLRANINAPGRSPILFTRNATHHLLSKSADAAQKQFGDLQRRYDNLQRNYDQMKVVKERSEARYKADYHKIKAAIAFFRSEEIQGMEDQLRHDFATLSANERKSRRAEIIAMKEKKIAELDAAEQDEIEDHSTPESSQMDKENQQSPVPEARKRHLSIPFTRSPTAAMPQSSLKLQPASDIIAPPLVKPTVAPTLIASARLPLQFHSINHAVKEPSSSPTSVVLLNDDTVLVPSSSQAAEDPSKESNPFVSSEIPPNAVPTRPAPPNVNSSNTEEDSQEPFNLSKVPSAPVLPHPPAQEDRKPLIMTSTSTPMLEPRLAGRSTVSPRPPSLQFTDQRSSSKARHSDTGVTPSTRVDDTDERRPHKIRRVSSPGPLASHSSMGEPGASAATPLYVGSGDTPRRRRDRDLSASTGKRNKVAVKGKGKGKGTELMVKSEISTPVANARASSSKQLTDYSAYKGRGRYANDGAGGDTPINASFVIDPTRNGGKDFQYDEVVRGREDRRNMNAGDCECCRDYYAAIGPMPNRLQAPLWRTPPSSPGSKPCVRNSIGCAQPESAEITAHKQAISRHRHQWAPTSTPPSYWSIGFPSTQEAKDINEKAREMHEDKKRNVQKEANRDGGRYKKR